MNTLQYKEVLLKSISYLSSSENLATQKEPIATSFSSESILPTPELIFCLKSSKLATGITQ